METFLQVLGTVGQATLLILVLVIQVGGMLLLLVNLPGTWVVLATIVVYGLVTGFAAYGWPFIIALAVLGVLGEVLEFLASAVGAQRFGASRGGVIGAVVGVFPGVILGSLLVPIPLLGTVIGAFAGAFLGAFLWELSQKRPWDEAFRAGLGAMLGRTGAVIAKLVIAIAMSGAFLAALLTGGPPA